MIEEGLNLETTGDFLVLVESNKVSHDELESITLTLDGGEGGTTPETIYAFEIASRYKPQ